MSCLSVQVREVERQRMEERAAHDNTISAVAAEVSRLKFGQAELVKAHRQYQVSPLLSCLDAVAPAHRAGH